MLALATVLGVPALLAGTLRVCDRIVARSRRMTILPVAVSSLRATGLRSLALAATGSLALFGSVALGGARGDLLHGISDFVSGYVAPADTWLITPRDHQATAQFSADGLAKRLSRLPGVRRVLSFQGGYLDDGGRSVWIIAWPPDAGWQLLDGQIVEGQKAAAASRIGAGGWVAVSSQLASAQHVGLGGALRLPTPTGDARFRIAATTTNLGWPSGAVLMSTADYRRAWDTSSPSARGGRRSQRAECRDPARLGKRQRPRSAFGARAREQQ
jgi:putative ABC transport system permease protein